MCMEKVGYDVEAKSYSKTLILIVVSKTQKLPELLEHSSRQWQRSSTSQLQDATERSSIKVLRSKLPGHSLSVAPPSHLPRAVAQQIGKKACEESLSTPIERAPADLGE